MFVASGLLTRIYEKVARDGMRLGGNLVLDAPSLAYMIEQGLTAAPALGP